jgi:hypothetical protein
LSFAEHYAWNSFGKKARMITIIQQPDSLSFSGNLKKFGITSTNEVIFELKQLTPGGQKLILSEKYNPDSDGLLTIDVKAIIDRLLDISIPGNQDKVYEQPTAVGDFFARVDNEAIPLRVIKGGVAELQETASDWLAAHFLTWQPQTKFILQTTPEWLGLFPIAAGIVKLKAYYADNTSYTGDYISLLPEKLYSINTSWGTVSEWLQSVAQSSQVVAWDVWYEVDEVQITPVQRYQLRSAGNEEHVFVWGNSIGGIDSVSFTGSNEEDQKLEHKNALYEDHSIQEYDIERNREIKQNAGFLDSEESRWIKDFFYSRKKYMVRADGSLKPIVVISSKIISNSLDDQSDFEFTYKYGEDTLLLNLERTLEPLQPPEGLTDFFLAELLSGLTAALYTDNLLMAVQSPFAQGWQNLSMSQLWGGALPALVDGTTISVVNGKLKVLAGTGGNSGGAADSVTWEELKIYIDSLTANNVIPDSRTELIGGAILWKEGFTYTSKNISYKILGVSYHALDKEITLDAADPALSRIDLFFVDIFGNLQVAKGTSGVNPASPVLDATQLEVMSVLITPGATAPQGIDVEKVYDENIEWTTSETHDNNVSLAFDWPFLPQTGSKRIKVAIEVPDSVFNTPLHYIGEKYQGGIIFWLDVTGKRGLIASETDTATDVFWSRLSGYPTYTTGASGIEIGTGQANTALMLIKDAAKDHAVKYCDELIIDSFDDWSLPSEKELDALYFNRYKIGNFGNKTYWSSTEVTGSDDWKKARCISFGNGAAYTRDKNNNFSVRAIRAFDDFSLPTGQPVIYFTPLNTKMTFASPVTVSAKDGILSLNLKSSIPWRYNSFLLIESYLAGRKTGMVSLSPSTSTLGYKSDSDQWQLVAIPMSKFSAIHDTLDAFKISFTGSWPNHLDLGIDDIRFQYTQMTTAGVAVAPGTYGSTKKSAVVTVNSQGVVTNITEVDTNPVDEQLTGVVNGVNRVYSTSYPFESGTITVFINGFKERSFIELSERQIELEVAPKNTGFNDLIEAIYIKKQV